jgi:predicted phage terminase large subunit-like protein
LAEKSLADFIRLGWRYIDPSDFLGNWHIDAICDHLQAVTRGEIRNLLINVPPRHMKSIGVSVAWPAWTWLQKPGVHKLAGPHVRWLYASYAQTLSIRDSVKCRRLVESPWYQQRWGDQFALTTDQNTKIRFDNDAHGYRLATSVDGALTGEGGDIVVVDDPHNVREADSPEIRAGTLCWWDEAMSTRLNDPKTGAYVVIMQRVHESDLSGHILAKRAGWTHLCLPARFEPDHPYVYSQDPRTKPGELLWPSRVGETEIKTLETSLGSYAAAGQLQQRPAPREGGMFKRRWFGEFVSAAPAEARRVRRWDLASTEASSGDPDWTAGLKMSVTPQGVFYIEDVQRFRASAFDVETAIKSIAAQDKSQHGDVDIWLPQDPGQAGKAQVASFARLLAGYVVRSKPETGSKTVRAAPFAAQVEAGNVKLVRGDWIPDFLAELDMFPNGSHDDQVDAASGAFHALVSAGEVTARVMGAGPAQSTSRISNDGWTKIG